MLNASINGLLRRAGFEIRRVRAAGALEAWREYSAADRAILSRASPYTITSTARIVAVVESVRYIVRNRIAGDLVECGVYRGGSMMAAALALLEMGDTSRRLFLYDTFTGMTEPGVEDQTLDGVPADRILASETAGSETRCVASLEEVQANVRSTGYPEDRLVYVRGRVEDTIPTTLPSAAALLRLDTDWYASTKHELIHLCPRLSPGGVLIIDDYGHWRGAMQATDEYFDAVGWHPYLHRVDYTGRLALNWGKPASV